MKKSLASSITIDGYRFTLEDDAYCCRGSIWYDEDHDARTEKALMDAAEKLKDILISSGHDAEVEEVEKGWAYVNIEL